MRQRLLGLTLWQWGIIIVLSVALLISQPPDGGPIIFIQWFLGGVIVFYLIAILPITAYRLVFGQG